MGLFTARREVTIKVLRILGNDVAIEIRVVTSDGGRYADESVATKTLAVGETLTI